MREGVLSSRCQFSIQFIQRRLKPLAKQTVCSSSPPSWLNGRPSRCGTTPPRELANWSRIISSQGCCSGRSAHIPTPRHVILGRQNFLRQRIPAHVEVFCHIRQDVGKRSHPQRVMHGDADVMLAVRVCGHAGVTTDLSSCTVTIAPQALCQFRARNVPWESHAAISSSRT